MNSKFLRRRAPYVVPLVICILLVPAAWGGAKYKVLHDFGTGKDGAAPDGPLLFDGKKNLYGNTSGGGTGSCGGYGCGTVFELSPRPNGIWREKVLHDFAAGDDGALPWGGLVRDKKGDLYGTLIGDNGLGGSGVFELIPGRAGWSNALIYTQGAGPGLVIDSSGNLYGAMGSGQHKYGAIAELSPSSMGWTYTALYSFCVFQCGFSPPAPPVWDGKGNLFGTTTFGGITQPPCYDSRGCGIAFEMTPSKDGTWAYHILHRFGSYATDGLAPYGGLVMDTSGNFYGTTIGGGAHGDGTVFKIVFTHGQWKKTTVYDFPPNCAEGCGPGTTLVFDKAGNLYGSDGGGLENCGGYPCGEVFKLTPQKNGRWKYTALYKFTGGTDGAGPNDVIVDDKAYIFGTTFSGGRYNAGVAFEITP
jgi:uncharacterized repeat protein (TIGR03803 family)